MHQGLAIAVALLAPAPPTLSVKLSPTAIRAGHSAKLTGTVSPGRPGTFVELQRRRRRTWRDQASAELRLSNHFSFTIHGRSKGKFSYRVTGAGRTSKTVTLTVT